MNLSNLKLNVEVKLSKSDITFINDFKNNVPCNNIKPKVFTMGSFGSGVYSVNLVKNIIKRIK